MRQSVTVSSEAVHSARGHRQLLPTESAKTGSETWWNVSHEGQLDRESYGSGTMALSPVSTNYLLVTLSHLSPSGVSP